MTHRLITDGSLEYAVADDDPLAADITPWAVVRTRVIDELTLQEPRTPVQISTNLEQATTRVAKGGICGLVARPRDLASALTTPGALRADIEAPGFLPRSLTPAIDAARRSLTVAAASGTSALSVVPMDSVPATQFRPGRGVMLERALPSAAEDFTTVALPPPPLPSVVQLNDPLSGMRPVGARAAGVPLVLPNQPMHRSDVVRLQGRALRRVGPPAQLIPAVGAEIGIRGLWRTYPATMNQAPLAPDVCFVEPGLRFAHPLGSQIETCTLMPVAPISEVREAVAPGAREIVIAPNGALNPTGGDLLRIGDSLTAEADIVVTEGFVPAIDPNQPVRVRLTASVAYLHRLGAPVESIAVVAPAAAGNIDRESLPGDAVLFSAGITALATNTVLAVERGTPRAAYYRAQQLPFTPDAILYSHQVALSVDGRFEWPPIARVAQLRVAAAHPLHPTQQIDFALDYGGVNTLTIVFG